MAVRIGRVQVAASAVSSGMVNTNSSRAYTAQMAAAKTTHFTAPRRGLFRICWSLGRRMGYQPRRKTKRMNPYEKSHVGF